MRKTIGIIVIFLMLATVASGNSAFIENQPNVLTFNSYDVSVVCDENFVTVHPHETAVFCVKITNTGTKQDTYILDCPDLIDCCYWSELTAYGLNLSPGESGMTILTVTPYFEEEAIYTITVRAKSVNDPEISDSVPTYTTVIIEQRTIDVYTDKHVYDLGETVVLSIKNICEETIEGNPEFEVFNSDGEFVYGCYPDCWIPLASQETFDCYWEPNVPQGKYEVVGRFMTYTETYEDDEYFYILAESKIDVSTDKLGYSSGEKVNLIITNVCDELIDGNPQFDIFDKDGSIVFSLRIYFWLELNPGESWFWQWDQKDEHGQQVPDGRYLLEGRLHDHEETYIDHAKFYIGKNNAPSTPIISGPVHGKVGKEYDYTFVSTDPDDDLIWYYICWGDLEVLYIYGPYHSGEVITLSYIYRDKGTWTIQCKAVDCFDASSIWTYYEVTMPRDRLIRRSILDFLQRNPHQFLILKRVISLLNYN